MHQALGAGLAGAGKLDAAEIELEEAVRLRPDYQEARTSLEAVRRLKK
jgi:hypothetical protein